MEKRPFAKSNARQENVMSTEITIAGFSKGLQNNKTLLLPYEFIQIVCNIKQLLLPRQEFTMAIFEGRIKCHSKGKSGLERASWLENFACPKTTLNQAKENKTMEKLPGKSVRLDLSCISLVSRLPFGGWQISPMQEGKTETQGLARLCLRK